MKLLSLMMVCCLGAVMSAAASDTPDYSKHPSPVIKFTTNKGAFFCELYPDVAPKHSERILTLAEEKFYDGVMWHRVVPGFVAQTGDPKSKGVKSDAIRLSPDGTAAEGLGMNGSDKPDLPLEVSEKQTNTRGALAMARKSQPVASANSQFYVVLKDAPFLNMQYTVFGRVLGDGMTVVDKLTVGDRVERLEVVKK
jgi:cyclophilin family peptidyl-prolyl cis-trans isomerase